MQGHLLETRQCQKGFILAVTDLSVPTSCKIYFPALLSPTNNLPDTRQSHRLGVLIADHVLYEKYHGGKVKWSVHVCWH